MVMEGHLGAWDNCPSWIVDGGHDRRTDGCATNADRIGRATDRRVRWMIDQDRDHIRGARGSADQHQRRAEQKEGRMPVPADNVDLHAWLPHTPWSPDSRVAGPSYCAAFWDKPGARLDERRADQ